MTGVVEQVIVCVSAVPKKDYNHARYVYIDKQQRNATVTNNYSLVDIKSGVVLKEEPCKAITWLVCVYLCRQACYPL